MKYWHKRVTLHHEVTTDDEGNEEIAVVLMAEDGDTYPLEGFIRSDGGRYDAVMGVSNTSAIGLILGADNDTGIIQAFG
tara:strand:+ start:807 stop:1043 length:237 start_codon:yes stop_codon:yes gene_type:complete